MVKEVLAKQGLGSSFARASIYADFLTVVKEQSSRRHLSSYLILSRGAKPELSFIMNSTTPQCSFRLGLSCCKKKGLSSHRLCHRAGTMHS